MKKMKTTKSRRRSTVKELVKNEEAVSPVIGVILMIAITVVIAAVVASFAYGIIGGVSKAPNAALVIEDATVGKTSVTVIHHGGDTVTDAFALNTSGTAIDSWDNLVVKHDGTNILAANVSFGGDTDNNFESGEQMTITVSTLVSGETISAVYIPSGDIMQRVKVA